MTPTEEKTENQRESSPQFTSGDGFLDRSLAQRMESLRKANVIRSKRAQLKRDLKAGQESIYDILLEPPQWAETMKVLDVLLAVPKYGRVKANKVLQHCRVSPSKTIGGMSKRQRNEVVSMLRR